MKTNKNKFRGSPNDFEITGVLIERSKAKMAKTQNNQTQIKELLGKLEKSSDKREKQKIRSELRSLGHKGGLNKTKKATKKKTKS